MVFFWGGCFKLHGVYTAYVCFSCESMPFLMQSSGEIPTVSSKIHGKMIENHLHWWPFRKQGPWWEVAFSHPQSFLGTPLCKSIKREIPPWEEEAVFQISCASGKPSHIHPMMLGVTESLLCVPNNSSPQIFLGIHYIFFQYHPWLIWVLSYPSLSLWENRKQPLFWNLTGFLTSSQKWQPGLQTASFPAKN